MVRNRKKVLLSYAMTLVMALSLMAGVVFTPVKKAKAFNGNEAVDDPDDDGRVINQEWDMFLSTEGDVVYAEAERQFWPRDRNNEQDTGWNTYRGEVTAIAGSTNLEFYIHYCSNNGGTFDSISPWYSDAEWSDASNAWIKKNTQIESTCSFDAKLVASDSCYDEEQEPATGYNHYIQKVTITPGVEEESFCIGYTDTSDNSKDIFATINVKKPDELWVSSNVNNLTSEVGTELYKAPGDNNTYLGKVYYYSSSIMYPNVNYSQVQDQNAGDWSSTDEWWTYRGIYDSDGNPLGSHIFYQYYHLDKNGSALTEDGGHPVSYLVYDEYPENTSTGATCQSAFTTKFGIGGGFVDSCPWTNMPTDGTAIIAPGEYHANVARTFNTDLYSVWGPYGSVTIDGDVMSMTLGRGYRTEEFANDERKYVGYTTEHVPNALREHEEHTDTEAGGSRYWVNDKGERIYWWSLEELYPNDRDAAMNNKVFQDEDFASDTNISLPLDTSSYTDATVSVNGNIGYVSLTDTYQGALIVGNNKSVEGMSLDKLANTAYRENEADITFYGTYIGQGQTIIENGSFINSIQSFDEGMWQQHLVFGAREDLNPSEIDNLNGYSVIMGGEKNNEAVSGTSSAVDTYGTGAGVDALDINVSESVGGGVFPMVRRKTHTEANAGTWKDPNAWWNAIKSYLNVTSATIMDIALVQDNENLVEPARPVNLYIDGPGARITGKALYHVRADGQVEKLTSNMVDGAIAAPTDSFSTYFIAEDKNVPTTVDTTLAALATAQHTEDAPVQLDPPYTPPSWSDPGSSWYPPTSPTTDTSSSDASANATDSGKEKASSDAEKATDKDKASADATKPASSDAEKEKPKDTPKDTPDPDASDKDKNQNKDSDSSKQTEKKEKKKQNIKVTPSSKTIKRQKLKKGAIKFKLKVTKAIGKISYKVVKGKNSSYIKVSKDGNITVKKNTPAGTYKIKVTAAATDEYKKTSDTVIIKVTKK